MNQSVIDTAAKFHEAIAPLEAHATSRVESALDASYLKLEKELRQAYPIVASNKDLLPLQRKLLLTSQLKDYLQLINPGDAQYYEDSYRQLLETTSSQGVKLAEELMRLLAPSSLEVRSLSIVNLAAVAAQARDSVVRLQRHSEAFRDNASAVIEQGLIQGWGTGRMVSAMRSTLAVTKGQAERIVRTESIASLDSSSRDRYQKAGISLVQIFPVLGARVCGFCSYRAGKVYRITEARIPAHPWCRCVSIPFSMEWERDDVFATEYAQQVQDEALELPNDGKAPFDVVKPAPLHIPSK